MTYLPSKPRGVTVMTSSAIGQLSLRGNYVALLRLQGGVTFHVEKRVEEEKVYLSTKVQEGPMSGHPPQ